MKMKKAVIKNYTPHPINIVDEEKKKIIRIIEPSGLVRLKAETVPFDELDGIKLTQTKFGPPEGLPEFQEGVFLIVSQLVKTAIGRKDLLVPAKVVRDENGNIIGCRSLGI